MNIIIPAFPSEYRKKMGFMTCVTDTYTYEDVSIYFTAGMDLSKKYVTSAYCFDLTKEKPYVSGFDASTVKEYHELIRTVMSNILAYDNAALNDYFNDIQPKLDIHERFELQKINEIYFMWKFLSGSSGSELDSSSACRVLSSFYSFYGIVDNKAAFLNRINGFWEKEIEKCRNGGYAPSVDVFNIVESHYPSFGDDDKRQAQRIWSFVLIYTVSDGNTDFCGKVFSGDHVNSELCADVFGYIARTYMGFIYRKDKNAGMKSVYETIIKTRIDPAAASNDGNVLFSALGSVIHEEDAFYDEMAYDRKDQYEVFSAGFMQFFEEPVAAKFKDAGLMRKFAVMKELKNYTYLNGADKRGIGSALGRAVYEHFHSSAFIPGVVAGITKDSIARMADDRKLITDLSREIEEYPELGNVDMIALFRRYCSITKGSKDISVIYELSDLVNKPDQQEMLRSWVSAFTKKFPDMVLDLFANSSCSIDNTGNMVYSIDYIGRDREQMLRELNRLIPDLETDCIRSEYKDLGLKAFREPTARFINDNFFDKSIDRKTLKENESMLKKFDKVKAIRSFDDGKEKKHKLFGKR